jgi:hypothetical protein
MPIHRFLTFFYSTFPPGIHICSMILWMMLSVRKLYWDDKPEILLDILHQQTVPYTRLFTASSVSYWQSKNSLHNLQHDEGGNYMAETETLPVSSATSERSLSGRRRVKSYLRSTMADKRLSNLSLKWLYTQTCASRLGYGYWWLC